MNTKVTLTYLLAIMVGVMLFVSCDSNDSDPVMPTVSAPESSLSIEMGQSVDITFNVDTEEGYQSANVAATNGNATIASEPSQGSNGGDVVVNYTGNTEGAGTVTLTVTDQADQTADATAAVAVGAEVTTITVSENITSDQTWETGKTYVLADRIAVEAGATLTIEGGAVVKGEAGSGANSTALLVARDGTLNANGTADAPIIFTSVADEITPEQVANGDFTSPNLDPNQQGLWGGVIILGNAPISASEVPASIEGIPSTDENGLYGGDDADDSSGSITYISIRHGGTNIGEGNEINGLSMGGVGTGTTIENVEIVANQDDGLEWFGGTVSVSNVLVWNNGDDALDTDQAWDGTVDNVVIVSPGESVMELDGPEGTARSEDGHVITNVSAYVKGSGAIELIDVDDNTDVNVSNVLFFGLGVTEDGNAAQTFSSDYPDYADNTNGYAITSIEAVLPDGTSLGGYFPDALINSGEVTKVNSVSDATLGATDVSVFSWTWASQSGALGNLGL